MKKLVFMQKQKISTNKRHAEHPFAGRNTQHLRIHENCSIFGVVHPKPCSLLLQLSILKCKQKRLNFHRNQKFYYTFSRYEQKPSLNHNPKMRFTKVMFKVFAAVDCLTQNSHSNPPFCPTLYR